MIDENVFIWMLESGDLVGVGLDVFEYELVVNLKFVKFDNVLLFLYMGLVMIEGWIEMGEKVIINIKIYMDGYCLLDWVLFFMF